jgi:hypothetical protein
MLRKYEMNKYMELVKKIVADDDYIIKTYSYGINNIWMDIRVNCILVPIFLNKYIKYIELIDGTNVSEVDNDVIFEFNII